MSGPLTPVVSPITLFGTLIPSGNQPIVLAVNVAGGLPQFASEAVISAVDPQNLVLGQLAYSQLSGITYQLTSATPTIPFANGTWVPQSSPSNAGSFTPGVQLAATGNITTFTGEQVIDGVLTNNSPVLLAFQTNPALNGIWVTGGAWARRIDANTAGAFVYGKTVDVIGGNTLSGAVFMVNSVPVTLGTDPITFVENSPGGSASVTMTGDVRGTSGANVIWSITGNGVNPLVITAASSDWTPSSVSNVDWQNLPAATATTTNAVTTLAIIATVAGATYCVDVQVQTRLNAAGDALSNRHTAFFINNGGTLTQQDATLNGTPLGTATGVTWPGVTIIANTGSIYVRVQGAAATTINWRALVQVMRTT